ncbi:cellulase [Sphaerotilus microaerophilus]|uniref:Cellulase n=1 Tax=Sphaerotilus microaerophilus TaxID=2914710 RepID=A0ABN6PLR7_9BURK|nr:cellulase [Sphaerotilus sp. FB-5]
MAAVCAALVPLGSQAACQEPFVRGVNLAGPGFGSALPGKLNVDYRFPTLAQMQYYKAAGFNSIRLSIKWERLQPKALGPLATVYLAEIKKIMNHAASTGLSVVIDLHNYDRYYGVLIGSGVPVTALADVWRRLATELRAYPSLLGYGLMNEPYNTGGTWEATAQAAVTAIRGVDMMHYVFVAGDAYSNAMKWNVSHPAPFINDPAGKEVYEAHTYFDADSSGKYTSQAPYEAAKWAVDKRLNPFILWLKKYRKLGVVGEWGVPTASSDWNDTVTAFMSKTEAHCVSTYVWAGGPWSPTYLLSLEPIAGVDRPVLSHLRSLQQ